jgi:putrescine aminotransferase
MFGVNHEIVTPDIMTLAKALGGGVMPIGATLSTPAIWERVFGENPLIHTSTFGGNQLACAAGLEALDVTVAERLSEKATERGAQLMAGLRQAQAELPDIITDVRGQGLMVGVEFAEEDFAALTINQMVAEGVIAAYTLNNPKVIRMEPPLIVSSEQVDQAVEVFLGAARMAKSLLEDMA